MLIIKRLNKKRIERSKDSKISVSSLLSCSVQLQMNISEKEINIRSGKIK